MSMLRPIGLKPVTIRRVGDVTDLQFQQGVTRNGAIVTNDFETGQPGGLQLVGGTVAGDGLTIKANFPGLTGPINFEMGNVFFGITDATIASNAGATLDLFVVSASDVTVTGATNITNPNGFNHCTINAPIITSPVNIGAGGTVISSATLKISGPPTFAGGGGGFVGNPAGLWVSGGNLGMSAQFDGNVNILGANGLQLIANGGNGLTITSGTTQISLNFGGFSINGTSLNFPINIASSTSNLLFEGNGTEAFRIFGNTPAGRIQFAAANLAANGTGAGLGFGSVAPLGAHVTPQEWLTVMGTGATQRWIPMF